jgi:tRNA threonylcarbamoyladenosine biosynthesis protein TsaE
MALEESRKALSLPKGDYISYGSESTRNLGKTFSSLLKKPAILALFGDLGAGKTTFVKGLVEGLGGNEDLVQSPTFVYLHCFEELQSPVYHFDLYRLQGPQDFLDRGFDEYFFKKGISVFEWPERILPLLPEGSIAIYFEHADETKRLIHWKELNGINS